MVAKEVPHGNADDNFNCEPIPIYFKKKATLCFLFGHSIELFARICVQKYISNFIQHCNIKFNFAFIIIIITIII